MYWHADHGETGLEGAMCASREDTMGRKFVDCRDIPSEINCTVAISADSEGELLEIAVQHAVTTHGHKDSPELRDMIRSAMKDGTPPIAASRSAA